MQNNTHRKSIFACGQVFLTYRSINIQILIFKKLLSHILAALFKIVKKSFLFSGYKGRCDAQYLPQSKCQFAFQTLQFRASYHLKVDETSP